MKTREEVIALFRAKYDYLKTVYKQVGPFDENKLYQTPDGGWQINFDNLAAITLRPNDNTPHETHGAICERWYREGGAFDESGFPGWLGYPISDEKPGAQGVRPPCPMFLRFWEPSPVYVPGAISEFEFGTIFWHEGLSWDKAKESHAYDNVAVDLSYQAAEDHYADGREEDMNEAIERMDSAMKAREAGLVPDPKILCQSQSEFAVNPGTVVDLNDLGRSHIPADIESASNTIANRHHFHPESVTKICGLSSQHGPVWTIQMKGMNDASLEFNLYRDASHNICGTIRVTPATPKTRLGRFFLGREPTLDYIFIPKP